MSPYPEPCPRHESLASLFHSVVPVPTLASSLCVSLFSMCFPASLRTLSSYF
jgi:hypothetical protein